MNIKKCDICKKQITKGEISVSISKHFGIFDICLNCGKPITKVLQKSGIWSGVEKN